MTLFRQALEEFWQGRIDESEKSPLTIRGILYLIRKKIGIDNLPTKSAFYEAIVAMEKKFGVPREDLDIETDPKINLITRWDESPILKVSESQLRNALALLYIEKSTIIKAIEKDNSLTDRGIHIIKAMGFSTRDVNKVIALAERYGLPIFTLTDLDPSGVLIDDKIAEHVRTCRLGITMELIRNLGLNVKDVREPLPRDPKKLTHLKGLSKEKRDIFIKDIGDGKNPYRVEIDGVWALGGKKKFMREILKKADEFLVRKDLDRILAPREIPVGVSRVRHLVMAAVENVYEKVVAKQKEKYSNLRIRFRDISLKKIEEDIESEVDKEDSDEIIKVLNDARDKIDVILRRR